jgi:flagellar biosynthetic protein FlhB
MAMAEGDRERRTLPATPRRRQEFRRRGVVPRSPDLGPAIGIVGLLAAVLLLSASAPGVAQTVASAIAAIGAQTPLTPTAAVQAMVALGAVALRVALPVLLVSWGMVVLGLVAFQGVSLSFAPGGLGRLNPLGGLSRLFSRQALGNLGLSVLKLTAALVAGVVVLGGPLAAWASRPAADLAASFAQFHAALLSLAAVLAGAAAVIAVASGVVARRRYEAELRMTPEEMREEMRRNDGDPLLRRRRMGQHRRFVRQRLVEAVRAADVVVVNPTHVAVALLYLPARMHAPEVTAKGADHVAERMREEARRAGVPVVENRPLARALWADVEVGAHVPPALFMAVAEVLAFVYRRRGYLPPAGGAVR